MSRRRSIMNIMLTNTGWTFCKQPEKNENTLCYVLQFLYCLSFRFHRWIYGSARNTLHKKCSPKCFLRLTDREKNPSLLCKTHTRSLEQCTFPIILKCNFLSRVLGDSTNFSYGHVTFTMSHFKTQWFAFTLLGKYLSPTDRHKWNSFLKKYLHCVSFLVYYCIQQSRLFY